MKLLMFLINFKVMFEKSPKIEVKENTLRYSLMSRFIKTKNSIECEGRVKELMKKQKKIDKSIEFLKNKIRIDTEQARVIKHEFLKFVETYYREQGNAFKFQQNSIIHLMKIPCTLPHTPQKFFKKEPESILRAQNQLNNFLQVIDSTINAQLKLVLRLKGDSEQFQEELSIPEKEREKLPNQNNLQSATQSQQNWPNYFDTKYISSIINTASEQKETQERTPTHWTTSEKYKFIIFLAMNKDLFLTPGFNITQYYYEKMSKFIGTNKNATLCENHWTYLCKKYHWNRRRIIEEEMKMKGIQPQYVEWLILTYKDREFYCLPIGNLTLKIINSPIRHQITRQTYSQMLSQTLNSQIYVDLPFYLQFQNVDDQKLKKRIESTSQSRVNPFSIKKSSICLV